MAPKTLELGPLELQILGLLSVNEPRSVAQVQLLLKQEGSPLAYTTVMTVLTRLYQKKHLKREKEGRQFLYVIAPEKEKARHTLFNRVKSSLFRKDRLNPILALLNSNDELSAAELKELKKVVDQKLKDSKVR